ncbi:MAG: hypothetical protein EA402_12415 [Planctomycetota bacterium]|nr:MAG: hypothetical protein EA402_12415 [Planctomycetota bacterium]
MLRIHRPNAETAIIRMDEEYGQQVFELVEDLSLKGVRLVVLDYKDVNFCSSLDIAQVINSRHHLQRMNGRVELANLGTSVSSIYRILKLDRLFRLDWELDALLRECGINSP